MVRNIQEEMIDRYNKLEEMWVTVERKLVSFHIPHPISIPMNDSTSIGFRKIGGKWRVCCSWEPREMYHPDWRPITDCPVDIRVDASSFAAKLMEAAVKAAEDFIPKMDEAIEGLRSFLGTS